MIYPFIPSKGWEEERRPELQKGLFPSFLPETWDKRTCPQADLSEARAVYTWLTAGPEVQIDASIHLKGSRFLVKWYESTHSVILSVHENFPRLKIEDKYQEVFGMAIIMLFKMQLSP